MSDVAEFKSPAKTLKEMASAINLDITSEKFQQYLDANDDISHFRDEFFIPAAPYHGGPDKECIYLTGNSLGLQPKITRDEIAKMLDNWKENGLQAYHNGYLASIHCDCNKHILEGMARLVGAQSDEVTVMNGLSVNLHLLLISFYRPTKQRHKVLLEAKAFPSDHYVVQSQIKQRGFDPDESMIYVGKVEESCIIEIEEYIDIIEEHGDEIALVLLPGVQYYTGQVLDMQKMTKLAHSKGCMVGFDLAHAVGNIELQLHDWEVDFAAWCTYKYLNSGPGCLAGAFLHEKHKLNDFPKLSGWWGHRLDTRLHMTNVLDLEPGIKGYCISNPPPLLVACIKASLNIFQRTTMKNLRKKSILLTGYLEYLLLHYLKKTDNGKVFLEIITPQVDRGCQLSLKFSIPVHDVYNQLVKHGVSCDIREPNVIRVAPVPLYNTFRDVFRFVNILCKVFSESFID